MLGILLPKIDATNKEGTDGRPNETKRHRSNQRLRQIEIQLKRLKALE